MAGWLARAAALYRRAKDGLMEYAYLVTLGAVIAVVAGAALYTDHVRNEQEAVLSAAAKAAEIAPTTTPRVTPLPTIAPMMATTTFTPRITTVRPVSGKVIRAYAAEPVLWEALGVMQAHEAIDIAGEAEGAVVSTMDGTVREVSRDALWGWRICIDHTDGSACVYAGLALSLVQPGENVVRGQEIGTLMERIPCEAELGAHLHLEQIKNGAYQDAEGILPE